MTHTQTDSITAPAVTPVMRTRPLAESPELTAKAINFLCERRPNFTLEPDEAQCVVPYLRWVSYSAGSYLHLEGDDSRTSYVLLLLDGEVSVDVGASGRPDRVAISVLGPGVLIGEMAFLDGAPRSASCTAITTVQAAGMSHAGLELMAKEQPSVAFKFLAYMARHTIGRLRALSEQLQMYDQLNATLHQEIARLRIR
jgi:CRP-like cAMP-binding protein